MPLCNIFLSIAGTVNRVNVKTKDPIAMLVVGAASN